MNNLNSQEKKLYEKIKKLKEQELVVKKKKLEQYEQYQKNLKEKQEKLAKQIKKEGNIKCLDPTCSKTYDSTSGRRRHMISKHRPIAEKLGYINFECEVCKEYTTKEKENLEVHTKKCIKQQELNFEALGLKIEIDDDLNSEDEERYQQISKYV